MDLVGLVEDTADIWRSKGAVIHLSIPEELVVDVDPERIRQALENLLANAIKHSPKGLPIDIVLQGERRKDREWATIVVQDSGPGIPPELLPRLFTRFASGDSAPGPRSGAWPLPGARYRGGPWRHADG